MNASPPLPPLGSPHLVVLGAGAVGGYIGGWLAATGANVSLLGRAKTLSTVQTHGYTLTDLNERKQVIQPTHIRFSTDPLVLQLADVVLVTVKSRDTLQAAQLLQAHAQPNAVVISFQNGVGNAALLSKLLPHLNVIAGMVPFNVVTLPNGHLHCGTEGQLCVQNHPALPALLPLFVKAGLSLQVCENFEEVQWGKLLLNLNNAVNALSDLPLKQELSQHAYRKCLALLMSETLQVLKKAKITPAKVSKLSPVLLPLVLRLPDFIFKRLASSMLKIDEQARSSMWEDLQHKRATEVNELNGAVVRLAQQMGIHAPMNARMVQLIQEAELGKLRGISGEALLQQLRSTLSTH
jgi:2-dehydropantoate 2-reductase